MTDEPTEMTDEPTELAGAAEAETQYAHAWALDPGDPDEFPTEPAGRLTPRRITVLGVAASLILIAVAGVVSLVVMRHPQPGSAPATVVPAATLDGTYRLDYNLMNNTIMGSPNPPQDDEPRSETQWRAFRSTCAPAGCTATSTALEDANHQIAATPPNVGRWHFVDDHWQRLPEKSRETRPTCKVDEGNTIPGDETLLATTSLEPQPDGSLRGLQAVTVISSECGEEGVVREFSFTATRVGDVPSGVVADPSTVSAQPDPTVVPVAGPILDGTYRFDEDDRQTTYSDGSRVPPTAGEHSHWFALRSICTTAGCAATVADLDDANHQEPSGGAGVFYFTDGHWVDNGHPTRISCGQNSRAGEATDEHTVVITTDLVPQQDGTLRGVGVVTVETNECGMRSVMTTPVVATRTGPVPPDVVLADPALFV